MNADHVAYAMVRPEWVVEIHCLDLVSRTTRDDKVLRSEDLRLSQVTDVAHAGRDARTLTAPVSEVLKREVYS